MAAEQTTPRVLVAEDDESLRTMMTAVLRRHRVDVTIAEDGQKAIEALTSSRFDVLVLDLMMPRVSGWEVLTWLQEHPERRPNSVIVATATDRGLTEKLNAQVVNAMFYKPFDIETFGSYVANCCRHGAPDRRRKRVFTI